MTELNRYYYLISVTRIVDLPNGIDVFEAVYSNGRSQQFKTYRYGDSISTMLTI